MSRRIDLTGQRYGRLVVAGPGQPSGARRRTAWLCTCDCGNRTTVRGENLRIGNTLSCGCLQSERTSRANTKHGMSYDEDGKQPSLYVIWSSMKQRCRDPKSSSFRNYGARGITVCAEWQEFAVFRDWATTNGYEVGLSIERVDVDGNYEPANCTWIPLAEQSANRRCVRRVTYHGVTKTTMQWAKEIGLSPSGLKQRLRAGWSVQKALTTPPRGRMP